jgi:hypothetical protein
MPSTSPRFPNSDTPGKKIAEVKTSKEAIRALKRCISDVV